MFLFYSVLSAITGSFLLATLDGINPAITVNIILIETNTIAALIGNAAFTVSPLNSFIM